MITNSHYKKVREELLAFYKSKKYNSLAVSLGYKEVKSIRTNILSIRFGVEKKYTYRYVKPEHLVPPTITIDNKEYKTDVYEARSISLITGYCYNTGDRSVPPNVPPPVSYNRARVRPLSGGVSMAAPPPDGYVNTGTLGGIVVDTIDGKLVGLTCNHVAGAPGGSYYESETPFFFAGDTYGSTSSAYRLINCYQNSSWDSGIVNNAADIIGNTKRCYPLTDTDINFVDVAVVNLDDSLIGTNSWYTLSAPFRVPINFATTEEINNLTLNDPIFKSGRTTGPVGNGSCDLRVVDTSVFIYVNGFGNAGVLPFGDILEITSPTSNIVASSGGDSGALVYACINSTNPILSAWKCIGVLFAGSNDGYYAYASRIDNITSLLQVSAWDGTPIAATPVTPAYRVFDYETYKYEPYIVTDNKIYWKLVKNRQSFLLQHRHLQ